MSSHFSPKSLAFYGGAIVFVATLFYFVTAYGEANLKPPNRIEGRYQLSTQNPPDCLQPNHLLLIQQSGVFLTGSLLPVEADKNMLTRATERPALSGRWDSQNLTLQGNVEGCPAPISLQSTVQGNVQKGRIDQATLNGTLSFATAAQPVSFIAKQEPPEEKPEGQAH